MGYLSVNRTEKFNMEKALAIMIRQSMSNCSLSSALVSLCSEQSQNDCCQWKSMLPFRSQMLTKMWYPHS